MEIERGAAMRILFDAYWWHAGPGANRTVQRELIAAWGRRFPGDALVLALRHGAEAPDAPEGAQLVRTRLWPHALANRWELPRLARRVDADAMLVHNYAPASGRSLVFLHDVMFEEHPEWFSAAERAYFSPMLPWARRAAAIATSTRTEAARIARCAPSLPAAAVTGLWLPPGLLAEPRRPPAVPEGAGFAITVGRLNVRKNLETVMLAAARAARITPASPLYVVGSASHSGRASAVPEAARAALDDGSIVLLDGVTDAELAWLYARAALVVSLSLDEGFGMPAMEAASFGAPLLVSDIAVYRETVGGYASFVEPRDAAAAAQAIDATWQVRPSEDARRSTVERHGWELAAERLRAALR
ncbi:glycosyltransferase [Agrococcus sp. 1P02AA]|uniref:glycosyltransferase n=1 Tax=Agrococcus sp. 1P02AA TaxID=3132259 RepID=UPI0039A4E1F5